VKPVVKEKPVIEVFYNLRNLYSYARLAKNQEIYAKGITKERAISSLLITVKHKERMSGKRKDYEIVEIDPPESPN